MKRGRKYRNLIYERLWWQLTPICITIFIVCLGGYAILPDEAAGKALAGTGVLFLLAGIIALSYAPSAYVQCRKKALRLRFPLYTLDVPYANIEYTRLFPVEQLLLKQVEANPKLKPSWSERKFLGPFMGEHAIVIQCRKMPRSHAWLRLWIGRRWLGRKSVVVVVRDWMSLRREIDDHVVAVQDELRSRATRYSR